MASKVIINPEMNATMKELMMIRVILPDGSIKELQQRDVRASDLIEKLLLNKHVINYHQQAAGSICINPNCIKIIPNYFKPTKVLSCDHRPADLEKPINPNLNAWWVCKSSSLRVGKLPCPLAPAARLQAGHLYYVLPIRAFRCRLTRSHVYGLVSAAADALLRNWLECQSLAAVQNVSQIQRLLQKYQLPPIVEDHRCCSALKTSRRNSKRVSAPQGLHSYCAAYLGSSGSSAFNVLGGVECRDARDLYIEQLMKRSKSWRPSLHTVRESRAH